MGINQTPRIVTDGLVFYSDAESKKSYDPSNYTDLQKWKDISGKSTAGIFSGSPNYNSGVLTPDVTGWTASSTSQSRTWSSVTHGQSTNTGLPTDWELLSNRNTYKDRIDLKGNGWKKIAYGDSKFVAVASHGEYRIMHSIDGTNWKPVRAPGTVAGNEWEDITFGDGKFVAIAGNISGTNKVIYSTDGGVNWTKVTALDSNLTYFKCITYGNGTFVVTGANHLYDQLAYSTDAINWTEVSLGSSLEDDWAGITYGDGKFVAVANGGSGNRTMYSSDGITWLSGSGLDTGSYWESVVYGNGFFVAVARSGSGATRCMRSSNGSSWSATATMDSTFPTDDTYVQWKDIAYGNGYFVAVAWAGEYRVVCSTDSNTWTGVDLPFGNQWNGITYGDGKFVAVSRIQYDRGISNVMYSKGGSPFNRFAAVGVGGDERAMYSDDGSNWSLIGNELDAKGWRSVTYGNGKYVAVANSSVTANKRIAYSYNGINWEIDPALSPENNSWESVVYAPEHIAPPDNWVLATAAEANHWNDVAYGNGKFVAVSSSGTNRIMYSTDGITWSYEGVTIENSHVEEWRRVAYGDYMGYGTGTNAGQGRWVAGSGDEIIYSDDGITWYESTPSSTQFSSPEEIIYANGTFIFVSSTNANEILTSITGGKTWEKVDVGPPNYDYHGLAYGNNTIVAIADTPVGDPCIAICTDLPDLAIWTTVSVGSGLDGEQWEDIAYGNGTFVAVGRNVTQNIIYSTDDGLTWTPASGQNTTADFKRIVYANGYFVAVAYQASGNQLISYSTDGINWSVVSVIDQEWDSITYGDGKFLAVSSTAYDSSANRVMYSESLIPNRFVAVSTDGTNRVMYSDNGIKWLSASAPQTNNWRCVTYGNGKFVAVASASTGNDRVMYSSDGINWTGVSVELNPWYSVTYGNGKFVAVASTGTNGVMYSSDGISWTAALAAEQNPWRSVTYGNGKFVAVSETGTNQVMYSSDAINWTSASATELTYWMSVTYGDNKFVSVNDYSTNRVMYTPTSIDAKSFDFNGVDQYVQTDANSLLEIGTQDFTMSCWFKYDAVKSDQVLIDNRTAHGNGTNITLAQVGSYMRARVWEDGENAYLYESDTDLMPNVWYNVTYVMDRPDGRFYINGVIDTGTNIEYSYVYTGGNKLTLAWNYSKQATKSLNGKMSNVLFYVGKALTESEVLQNYNALKGRYK